MQAYSDPSRESDPHALPDVEVFYTNGLANADGRYDECEDGSPMQAGWYYWFCFPGCMPDSDPVGPFATQDEAIADARQA